MSKIDNQCKQCSNNKPPVLLNWINRFEGMSAIFCNHYRDWKKTCDYYSQKVNQGSVNKEKV